MRIKGKDNLEELAIVEFQGEILGEPQGELGKLQINGTKVDMTLGQHTLVGTVVNLKNPFLVLEKKPICDETAMIEDNGEDKEENTVKSRMACHGVVLKKILFNTRPTPIRMKSKK